MFQITSQLFLKFTNILISVATIWFVTNYFSADSQSIILYLLLIMNLFSFLSFMGLENVAAKIRSQNDELDLKPIFLISLLMNTGLGFLAFRNFEIIDILILIIICFLLSIIRFFVIFHNLDGRINIGILSEGPVLTSTVPLIMFFAKEDLTFSIFLFAIILIFYLILTQPKNTLSTMISSNTIKHSGKFKLLPQAAEQLWRNKNTSILVLLVWGVPSLVTMRLDGSNTFLIALSLMNRINNVARIFYYLFNARELARYLNHFKKNNNKDMLIIDFKLLIINFFYASGMWMFVMFYWDMAQKIFFNNIFYDFEYLVVLASIGYTLFGVRPQVNIINGISTLRLFFIGILAGIFIIMIYSFGEDMSISLMFIYMFCLNACLFFPIFKGKIPRGELSK